jgi:hypothetical protein
MGPLKVTGGRLTEIQLIKIVFFHLIKSFNNESFIFYHLIELFHMFFQLIESFINVIFAFKKFQSTAKKQPTDFGS